MRNRLAEHYEGYDPFVTEDGIIVWMDAEGNESDETLSLGDLYPIEMEYRIGLSPNPRNPNRSVSRNSRPDASNTPELPGATCPYRSDE